MWTLHHHQIIYLITIVRKSLLQKTLFLRVYFLFYSLKKVFFDFVWDKSYIGSWAIWNFTIFAYLFSNFFNHFCRDICTYIRLSISFFCLFCSGYKISILCDEHFDYDVIICIRVDLRDDWPSTVYAHQLFPLPPSIFTYSAILMAPRLESIVLKLTYENRHIFSRIMIWVSCTIKFGWSSWSLLLIFRLWFFISANL